MLDPSTTYRLSKIINKIDHNTFDESDIRNLLIEIRDYLPSKSLIRDIAHFIAHPGKRDRGLFHRDLSLFAYKFKLVISEYHQPIKVKELTEDFYHMTIYGIEQLNINIMINGIPYRTDEAVKIFKHHYKKDKQVFKLIEPITKRDIDALSAIFKRVFTTIVVKPFTTEHELITTLNDTIDRLITNFNSDVVVRNSTDIMICLMSIIQNVDFRFHDNSRAFLQWLSYPLDAKGKPMAAIALVACLEGPEYVDFCFEFIALKCDPSQYGIKPCNQNFMSKRLYHAERNAEGNLILKLIGETMPFQQSK